MIFGGIDGGKDGAIVILNPDGGIISLHKTPLVKSAKGRDEYDIPGIVRILKSMPTPSNFTLEKGQPMPAKMGGAIANFSRGYSFGLYQAVLTALGISYNVVAPRTWQKVLFTGVNVEDTKAASILVAKRLWPAQDWRKSERAVKDNDGLTDAALLAYWGLRTLRPVGV